MKTLYMTMGLPASGKTQWARAKMAEHPGAFKRVNKDDLRAMVDCGKWSRENESMVVEIRDFIITSALFLGKHVIVDDTNLAPKHQERLRQVARGAGAAFEIVDFTHVDLEECIRRDSKRPNYVGEKVIRSMWKQFLAPPVPVIEHNPAIPDCILVDIDGTVAKAVDRGFYEWAKVGSDAPNSPVCRFVQNLEAKVIFISGRDECCRAETESWLMRQFPSWIFTLHMRPQGDMRDDRIVKRELYEREILGKYNVSYILDDRNKVVEMWRSLGLLCFQVAEGDF